MTNFRKWNDLQQFHEVVKNLNYPAIHAILKENEYTIPFGLKIKLHGTNACVRIEPDGKVVAQKRSSDLGYMGKPEDAKWVDNAGFAAWVQANESYFGSLADCKSVTYIYGEWCGPGIQQNVACSDTPQKTFWVFSIDHVYDENTITRIYEPDAIEAFLRKTGPDTIIVIPWHSHIDINFLEKPKTEEALARLNIMVENIGTQDPLIKEIFDLDGCGEGVVAYPLLGAEKGQYSLPEEKYFTWFNFKAKSEAHRVNKTKTAAAFDPEKYASVQIFTDAYVTEARLLQAFDEAVQRRRDMRLTPDFIKWVVQDIWKESKTERETNTELDWKAISKAISSRAVIWYKAKVQELADV
jgi:hypothetical protein